MHSPSPTRVLVLLSLAIVLLGLPRFNRNDWLIGALTTQGKEATGHLADAGKYMATVDWIRGESSHGTLYAPYSYRVLFTALASRLPFDSMTSINVLNVLFLVGTLILLYRLQETLGIQTRSALWGCALFVFSFPTFYYGTVGYIDPGFLFLLALGLNLIYGKIWWAAALTVGLGLLGKEGTIMLMPALGVALWQETRSWKTTLGWLFVATGLWIALWYGVRALVPVANQFQWSISLDLLLTNLGRPRSWLTLIMSGSTLLVPFLLLLLRRQPLARPTMKGTYGPLWTGLGVAIGYYMYSWTTAYVDGRMLWPVYLFAIPIAICSTTSPESNSGAGRSLARSRTFPDTPG